jgi:GNAT superfamily N-acetyltransferase
LLLSEPGHFSQPDGTFESHRIIMFSSADPIDPIGFLGLERRLTAAEQAQRIALSFRVASIYVMPEHRGLGYGTALCVGAGVCCGWEIRHQLERYRSYVITLSPGLDTTVLIQQHPRLTHAMEGRIAAMMDRNMEAPLSRCNACLEVLHR